MGKNISHQNYTSLLARNEMICLWNYLKENLKITYNNNYLVNNYSCYVLSWFVLVDLNERSEFFHAKMWLCASTFFFSVISLSPSYFPHAGQLLKINQMTQSWHYQPGIQAFYWDYGGKNSTVSSPGKGVVGEVWVGYGVSLFPSNTCSYNEQLQPTNMTSNIWR